MLHRLLMLLEGKVKKANKAAKREYTLSQYKGPKTKEDLDYRDEDRWGPQIPVSDEDKLAHTRRGVDPEKPGQGPSGTIGKSKHAQPHRRAVEVGAARDILKARLKARLNARKPDSSNKKKFDIENLNPSTGRRFGSGDL